MQALTKNGPQTLASASSTFTSQPAKVKDFATCAYSVRPVPIGQMLQVQITIAPATFAQRVTVSKLDPGMGAVTIPGGDCTSSTKMAQSSSSTPSTNPSTTGATDPGYLEAGAGGLLGVVLRDALSGPMRTCGPNAYNVDYLLSPEKGRQIR